MVNRPVVIKLVSGSAGGFIGSSTEVLLTTVINTDPVSGVWQADNLEPNVNITPANTYYTVQQAGETLSFVVPNTAGPFWLYDILVQSPTSPSGLVVGALASRQIIAGAGLQDPTLTDRVVNVVVELIALLLPALDGMTQTTWLLGSGPGLSALGPVVGQTALYLVLICSAALFDLYRKNF